MEPIVVIGAGLAGCEAAWQIAKRGGKVTLHEMKPGVYSPAHRSPFFAEIVCSNSFKSESLENGPGVLKKEMELLESLILKTARETRVPAGGSLAVDREAFSKKMTQIMEKLESVEIIRNEVSVIPDDRITVIATGPLTSEALSREIQRITGDQHLFFYDAISPIVTADSIDFGKVFKASRYGKGGEDYLNCPMGEDEYYQFVDALNQAEKVSILHFERRYLFEGCLPIEELAARGKDTLAFGPLKPVGLIDPKTGKQPFAVIQLRQEDQFGTLFNLVGFQTRLKHEEQKRVFRDDSRLGEGRIRSIGFRSSQYLHRFTSITEGGSPVEGIVPTSFLRARSRVSRGIWNLQRWGFWQASMPFARQEGGTPFFLLPLRLLEP